MSQIFHYLADYPGFVITVDYGAADQTSYQPEAIVNLARRYPELDFVVCHLSFPDAQHPYQLVNVLAQFATLDNISVDISAIQDILGEGRDDFPYPKSQWVVRLAKKWLGAKRIIWGSDAPWSAAFNDYHQLATWLERTAIFTPAELADVMANNAARIYFKPTNVQAARKASTPALARFKAHHPGTVD